MSINESIEALCGRGILSAVVHDEEAIGRLAKLFGGKCWPERWAEHDVVGDAIKQNGWNHCDPDLPLVSIHRRDYQAFRHKGKFLLDNILGNKMSETILCIRDAVVEEIEKSVDL